VYCALSPLHHINLRKKNWAYFIDKNDFLAYVQDQFMKNYEVLNSKGKKYTKSQLHSIIMRNHPYKDLLKSIADTYAIYPVLLEDILVYRKLDFKKFKKSKNEPKTEQKGEGLSDDMPKSQSENITFPELKNEVEGEKLKMPEKFPLPIKESKDDSDDIIDED
jgi:transposase